MAAAAKDDMYENQVAQESLETERALDRERAYTERCPRNVGIPCIRRRNGGYGTGIQGMVEAGDRWENEKR